MRRPVELEDRGRLHRSTRRTWLAVFALASVWCGVAGLFEPAPESTGRTRCECTRGGPVLDDRPAPSRATRACTPRELREGGLWKGVL
jgi:hypothetical protein